MSPAVAVSGLTRRFGTVTAVDGLSFDVERGELFGIVGPDGAGKTTTLRMLAGVLTPTEGDARLGGISVSEHPEEVKHKIAYMSQRFGLYTDLTVRENIDFYADLYLVPQSERRSRLERLYAFSGLGPFEHRLAGQLSGGMKQKLGLCCALIHEPEILLLDEPTFGVDPISRRDLWLIVHEMFARGITVVVATAYLDEAERCDRVALLHNGRMAALDTPEAFQQHLAGHVRMLLVEAPRRALTLLDRLSAVEQATLFGDAIHVTLRDPERDWSGVRDALHAGGIPVLEEGPVEPSLEDVFIHLVQQEIPTGG